MKVNFDFSYAIEQFNSALIEELCYTDYPDEEMIDYYQNGVACLERYNGSMDIVDLEEYTKIIQHIADIIGEDNIRIIDCGRCITADLYY